MKQQRRDAIAELRLAMSGERRSNGSMVKAATATTASNSVIWRHHIDISSGVMNYHSTETT